MQIPQLGSDTVLVLDKKAALLQSNHNLKSKELRVRFATALRREEKLLKVWEATELQLSKQEQLNKNLKAQIVELEELAVIREEETAAIDKLRRKQKRKSFVTGFLLGTVTGVIGTTILLTR